VVSVGDDWTEEPQPQAVWAYETADLKTQLYRVLSVKQGDGITFEVNATQHEPQKFAYIDSGTKIQPRPITIISPGAQVPPTGVTAVTNDVIDQGISETIMVISWQAAKNAVSYNAEWSRDGGAYIPLPATGTQQAEVQGIYAGSYLIRVKAVNAFGVESIWAYSALTALTGSTTPPPSVSSLTTTSLIFGIQLDWGFPEGPNTVQRTEIWYSESDDRTTAVKLGDFAYPQNTHTMMGLAAGTEFFFWTRLVDKIGNVGAWFPIDADAGIVGQASSSAAVILQYLLGQITDSQLGAALLTKINAGAGASVSVDQVVSELAAMYTIKTQFVSATGRTYIAGIGVGVENDDGVIESQVLVAASRFAVIDPNGTTVGLPFVIEGGQVFIDQAFIQDASIGSAKIADIIQSDNYVAGVSGWKIDKSGAIEVNNLTARGNITADSVTANSISTNGLQLNSVTTMASWSGLGTFAYSGSGGDVLVIASVTGAGETGGAVNFSIDGDVFTVGGPPGSTTSVVKRYSAWTGAKSLQAYAPSGGTGPITDISLAVLEAKR
jgi:predicted phage tail protein